MSFLKDIILVVKAWLGVWAWEAQKEEFCFVNEFFEGFLFFFIFLLRYIDKIAGFILMQGGHATHINFVRRLSENIWVDKQLFSLAKVWKYFATEVMKFDISPPVNWQMNFKDLFLK